MTRIRRCFVGAVAAAAVVFATAAAARAQTCTLTLKRRETNSAHAYAGPTDYMYWSVQPQHFYVQMNADRKVVSPRVYGGDQSQAEAFKRIVKKEPKYQSEYPFRGVLKLGSQQYAFALDVAAPAPAPKAKKPEAKPAAAKAATEPEAGSDASRRWAICWSCSPARRPAPSRPFLSRPSPTTGSTSISITTAT